MKKEIKKKKQLNTAALNFLSMDNNTIRHLWWKMMLWSWGCLAKNAKANLIGFAVKSSQQLVVPQKAFATRIPLIHLVFSDSLSILISLDTVLAVSRLGYARYVMGGSRTSTLGTALIQAYMIDHSPLGLFRAIETNLRRQTNWLWKA